MADTTTRIDQNDLATRHNRQMNRNAFCQKMVGKQYGATQLHDGALRVLQDEYGESLIVAGGAIRDTILGVPYQDIDIFLAHGLDCQRVKSDAMKIFGLGHVTVLYDDHYQSKWMLDYRFDFANELRQVTKINIIWGNRFSLGNPHELLGRFDLAMNQFAFDNKTMYYTDEAMLSLMGRQIRLVKGFKFNTKSFTKIIRFVQEHDFKIDEETMVQLQHGFKIPEPSVSDEYTRDDEDDELNAVLSGVQKLASKPVQHVRWDTPDLLWSKWGKLYYDHE